MSGISSADHDKPTSCCSCVSTTFLTDEIASRIPASLRIFYPWIGFIAGAFTVSLTINLTVWANNCDVSSSVASWALVTQGLGVLCSMLYVVYFSPYLHAHDSIPFCLVALGCIVLSLPYITSIYLLCVFMLFAGFFSNVMSSEVFNLLRKLYGPYAGPWCSLSLLAVSLGSVFGTVLKTTVYVIVNENDASSVRWSFGILGSIFLLVASAFLCLPDPEGNNGESEGEDNALKNFFMKRRKVTPSLFLEQWPMLTTSGDDDVSEITTESGLLPAQPIGTRGDFRAPHYYVEYLLAIALLATYGGKYIITSYLTTFADVTGIESDEAAYYQAVSVTFFIFIGMLLGILDQGWSIAAVGDGTVIDIDNDNYLHRFAITNKSLPWRIMGCFFIAGISVCFVLIFPSSAVVYWVATSVFALASGPLVGYLLDWLNRSTYATQYSTGIALTGLHMGSSTMVLLTLGVWYICGVSVWSVIYVASFVSLLVIPLVWYTQYLSYRIEVNPNGHYRNSNSSSRSSGSRFNSFDSHNSTGSRRNGYLPVPSNDET